MTIQERDKQIIDLYLNHPEILTKDIAKQFNISTATIARIARINNLPRRTGTNNKTFLTDQQINEIKQRYSNSESLISLQKEYKISYDRIKNIVKDCELISSAKRLNPNLKENYFEKIDSNEKAYWLGWIISDGAITNQPEKSKFQLEITIKEEDEDILHLLEKDLGVEHKVYSSQKIYRRFSLGSKKIILDLEKLGVTQNKSFTVKVPKFDSQYNAAFIRGVFDGDGGFTTYIRQSGQLCYEFSICGNEYIVSWILETLLKEIPELKHNSVTSERSIKRIRWSSKKDIILLRDYLYKNHNYHYLKRKYNLIYANTEVTPSITKGEEVLQSVEGE